MAAATPKYAAPEIHRRAVGRGKGAEGGRDAGAMAGRRGSGEWAADGPAAASSDSSDVKKGVNVTSSGSFRRRPRKGVSMSTGCMSSAETGLVDSWSLAGTPRDSGFRSV